MNMRSTTFGNALPQGSIKTNCRAALVFRGVALSNAKEVIETLGLKGDFSLFPNSERIFLLSSKDGTNLSSLAAEEKISSQFDATYRSFAEPLLLPAGVKEVLYLSPR